MKKAGCSILFMRDDLGVRTLRISPRRLRVLLWSGAVLCLLVIAALGVGLWSFVGYRTLRAERRSLELSLADAEVAAERAGNIAQIARDTGAGGRALPRSVRPEPAPAAGRAFARLAAGGIGVGGFRARIAGGGLDVSFDLTNKSAAAEAGGIRLLLLRNDGRLLPLAPRPAAALAYQITRFKHIAVSAGLPQGLPREEALGVRVEINNAKGGLIFGETFALGG